MITGSGHFILKGNTGRCVFLYKSERSSVSPAISSIYEPEARREQNNVFIFWIRAKNNVDKE